VSAPKLTKRDAVPLYVAMRGWLAVAERADSLIEKRHAFIAAAWCALRLAHAVPPRARSHIHGMFVATVRTCLSAARELRRMLCDATYRDALHRSGWAIVDGRFALRGES
jgi:hypothetical protein